MVLVALLVLRSAWKPYPLEGIVFRLPSAPRSVGGRSWISKAEGATVTIQIAPVEEAERGRADGVLATALDEETTMAEGRLLAQADALVRGWPALDARYRSEGPVDAWVRLVVVNDLLVTATVDGTSEKAAAAVFKNAASGIAPVKKGSLFRPGPAFSRRPVGKSGASVEFPRPPREDDFPLTSRRNSPRVHRSGATYGNRKYEATYVDAPPVKPGDVDRVLEAVNRNAVESHAAETIRSTPTTLGGLKALQTVGDAEGQATVVVRSAFQGSRLYTLVATVPTAWKSHPEPRRFFESFRFKP